MKIGSYEVTAIVDGTFALDGGAMFGIVPKPLWARHNSPDERNRIRLASRLLLLESSDCVVLVDTGLGDKWDEKRRDIFDVRRESGVVEQLAARGIDRHDVTDVLLTHLHFDHAGGTSYRVGDDLRLTFPQARHHLQRRQWEWANNPTLKDAGSFRAEDFALLASSDRLLLADGAGELLPGIEAVVVDGHTPGMQMAKLSGAGGTVLFVADLVPTVAHLRWPYIMAYDNEPLTTLADKQRYLSQAAEEQWLLVLEHDPIVAAVRVQQIGGRLVAGEPERLS